MLLAASLGIAQLAGCNATEPQPRIEAQFSDWRFGQKPGRKIETEHYEIYTTLTDEVLLATFPELMERTFRYYQQQVPPKFQPEGRMPIYLFESLNEWAYFTQRFTGPRAPIFLQIRNGGYSERGVTVIQYVSHQTTFPLMAHEGLHQYLYHYVNPKVPAWLNEGLAVLCEGQRWTGAGLRSFDPAYNPSRQNVLAAAVLRDELLPLTELLETNAGRIVGETSRKVATYYAQVWALVRYLQEGDDGRYAPAYREMCAKLSEADFSTFALRNSNLTGGRVNAGEALFRKFITDDIETFEQGYRAFLRQGLLGQEPVSRANARKNGREL
ncbi:MAG: hypothetical protein SF069_12510 [Phycisphaerae bacterium]|nr:hypothetical protein [Phycisphaerae bacterium]